MNTCSLLAKYKNGNYQVRLFSDGTKIRFSLEDEFNAVFPESIDVKITNYCDMNCPMCHENSGLDGSHGNLNHPFFDTLVPGTELAIGGGNPLSHPELISFLNRMKNQGIICNLTVNQNHFIKNIEYLQNLIDEKLIYGLGISFFSDFNLDKIVSFCNKNHNTVIHIIAGVIDIDLLEKLYDYDIKILVLGYKEFGRGINYYNDEIMHKIEFLKNNIIEIGNHFSVLSFDNLAITQLDMENKISKEEFEQYYMGDDGNFTMYIDLVKEEFAVSSTRCDRYKLKDNIFDMFNVVKSIK
jgi:organic radical activating enzyme